MFGRWYIPSRHDRSSTNLPPPPSPLNQRPLEQPPNRLTPLQPPPYQPPQNASSHRGILYEIPNLMNSLTRKNWAIPSINMMILKIIWRWGMAYERQKRFSNPNPNREAEFLTQTGEAEFLTLTGTHGFLILIMIGKVGIQVLMSIGWKLIFFLLVETLILNPSWIGFMK